jgi:hypothetical protein
MKFKNLIYHIGLLVFIVFILAIFFHDTAVALTDAQKASLVSFGSDLQSNNGITEADPIFTASPASGITANNINAWNNTNSIVAGNASAWTGKQAALGYTPANVANMNSTQVGLGNVENTKLSTWAGTGNITTVGTIVSGIWQGTAIANSYIANAASWLTSAFTGTANIVSLGTITSGTWNANAITDSYVANSSKWNNSYNAWNTNGTNWNSTYADWNANKANWDNFSSANKVTFTTTGATTLTYSLTSGNAPLCNTAISANNVVCWKATGSLGHCSGNNTGNGTCNCI